MRDDLPAIRGQYMANYPLAALTTIKVGGAAEVWADFADWDDVQFFMKNKPMELSFTLIGEGSNMIIPDAGLCGVVARLGKGFDAVQIDGEEVYAEAGATCGKVARAAREAALEGLAFLCGIPGSVGGALRMNAGAYGNETFDKLIEITLLTHCGDEKKVTPQDIVHGYRHTELPEGWLFKAARWRLQSGDKVAIKEQMREINSKRRTSQPLEMPSSGSWFRNPMIDGQKVNAWKVVEAAGCRGLQIGGARVSDKHCNFFVNMGNATAADFMALSEEVERRVKDSQGIELVREVRFVG
jgi:UDP-N-acetylmuramate dehydrogenase